MQHKYLDCNGNRINHRKKSKSKQPGIGSAKLTVGLISGGINTNVVPDRIAMRLDRRLIPEENGAKVEKALVALIKRAAKGKTHRHAGFKSRGKSLPPI